MKPSFAENEENETVEITTSLPVSLVLSEHADRAGQFDFRLLFANRIVERSWEEHRTIWTREDVGLLLMEVLEEEFGFDWSDSQAVDQFKELLVMAYVAAGDVLPAHQRTF